MGLRRSKSPAVNNDDDDDDGDGVDDRHHCAVNGVVMASHGSSCRKLHCMTTVAAIDPMNSWCPPTSCRRAVNETILALNH